MPVGPYSKNAVLGRIDIRTREGRTLKKFTRDLTDYITDAGVTLNFVQRVLVERVAQLYLRVRIMDDRFLATGDVSDADYKNFLAYNNAIMAILLRIVPKDTQQMLPPPPSLAQYLQAKEEAGVVYHYDADADADDDTADATVTLDALDDGDAA